MSIEQFRVLNYKLTPTSKVNRQLIVRKCEDDSIPLALSIRAIEVLSIPPLVESANLQLMFSHFGKVDRIILKPIGIASSPEEPSIDTYRRAIIVFSALNESKKVLAGNEPTEELFMSFPGTEAKFLCGMDRWIKEYNDSVTLDVSKTQAELERDLKLYDQKVEFEKKHQKETANEPDEEGWITVKKSRAASKSRDKQILKKVEVKKAKSKSLDSQVPEAFQYKVGKRDKLGALRNLRQKFEEDKNRLAQAKANRKFKP